MDRFTNKIYQQKERKMFDAKKIENARQKKKAKKTENYAKEFCGGGSAIKWN